MQIRSNMQNHIIPYFRASKIKLQDLTNTDLEAYYKSKLKKGSKLMGEYYIDSDCVCT